MTVFGTRPEAIKMAPVIKELEKYNDKIYTIVTISAQHRQMLDQVLAIFNIKAHYDLNVMTQNQRLASLTSVILNRLDEILHKKKVDFLLVQGDTTTTFAASLAAFYNKIPVGHIEAGLRTHDMYYPFPEEMNRVLTSRLTTVHFAPTTLAQQNLLKEGVNDSSVIITGNTVIDALKYVIQHEKFFISSHENQIKNILVTAHRRESFGKPLEDICHAILDILSKHEDVKVIFPVHLNPNVQQVVRSLLQNHPRIHLSNPLDYVSFSKCIAESYIILTDSGGIQEEAPSLGKPVLVLRNETERQEALNARTVRLVGTQRDRIVQEVDKLLTDKESYLKMARAVNPYGDGKASYRIVNYILEHFYTHHGHQ